MARGSPSLQESNGSVANNNRAKAMRQPEGLLLSVAVIVPARYAVARFFPVSWTAAVAGALVGGSSHVLLDPVIHPDIAPFAPWLAANTLFLPGSFVWVHALCAAAGLLGALAWCARRGQAVPT